MAESFTLAQERDFEVVLQRACENHLAACNEALFEEGEVKDIDDAPPSPAFGPFCGCDTCVVREILHVAWPMIEGRFRD